MDNLGRIPRPFNHPVCSWLSWKEEKHGNLFFHVFLVYSALVCLHWEGRSHDLHLHFQSLHLRGIPSCFCLYTRGISYRNPSLRNGDFQCYCKDWCSDYTICGSGDAKDISVSDPVGLLWLQSAGWYCILNSANWNSGQESTGVWPWPGGCRAGDQRTQSVKWYNAVYGPVIGQPGRKLLLFLVHFKKLGIHVIMQRWTELS